MTNTAVKNVILDVIGERLFERLQYLKLEPRYILHISSDECQISQKLKQRFSKAEVIQLSIEPSKNSVSNGFIVQGNINSIPLETGIVDLVFANQIPFWTINRKLLLREINRIVNVNGCILFSTLGPDTFQEVKYACSQIDSDTHKYNFVDMHEIGDNLLKEHFIDPVVDMEMIYAHYSSLPQLLNAIRTPKFKNKSSLHNPGLTGKTRWQKFEKEMQTMRTEAGKYQLSYEVIYGQAWKGEQHLIDGMIETRIAVDKIRKHK